MPAVTVALMLCAAPGIILAQYSPTPPTESARSWYNELRGAVFDLEEADVKSFERHLTTNPENSRARFKLMAYHRRADRLHRPEDRWKRVQHLLWLIEHHPDSYFLDSAFSRFSPGEVPAAEYRRVVALWSSAVQARPTNAAVRWNAATFFKGLDADLHLHYLEATIAADANHPYALRPLAHLYALAILEGGTRGAHSQTALDASKNVWVIGNAAHMFQLQYNRGLQLGTPNKRAAELAERNFVRAVALDPNLQRKWILPKLDLQAEKRRQQDAADAQRDWTAKADAGLSTIRRLSASAFPELPPAVAGVLRARNCTVPQPFAEDSAQNLIRGEFFAKGEAGWAVFCSVNNSTTLLAFRNERDTQPVALSTSADRPFVRGLMGGKFGYGREITSVDRASIFHHYRSYGGPEPPPIDHQGIKDQSFGKQSPSIWYFHQGKWLQLRGAD